LTKTIHWLSLFAIATILLAGSLSAGSAAFADNDDDDDDDKKKNPFKRILKFLKEIRDGIFGIQETLDSPDSGLIAIKTAVDNIDVSGGGLPDSTQAQIDDIQGKVNDPNFGLEIIQNSQYVPFLSRLGTVGAICDEPGGLGDNDQLVIDSSATSGTFIVTSVFFEPIGVNEEIDSIRIVNLVLDNVSRQIRTQELNGLPNTLDSFDLMGVKLDTGEGLFPHQMVANSNGPKDIKIVIACDAGTSSSIELEFGRIIVSGWKQADDTIMVTLEEQIS